MPHKPAPYDKADSAAIQALSVGAANDVQQKRAFKYIVEVLSGYYDLSYRPDDMGGRRATDFMEGRRYVGAQLVKLSKLNLASLDK